VRSRAYAHRILFVAVALGMLALTFGCNDAGPSSAEPEAPAAVQAAEAVAPAPWDLSTPETAVRSYLDWVSFSYRMANSDIPTATMTAEEAVRVDSYIQLNRMEGKGIEQSLDSIELVPVSQDASTAVVAAVEVWRYRYFSLDTLEYLSEEYRASYDATYTLVAAPEGWLVQRVEVSSGDEVQ